MMVGIAQYFWDSSDDSEPNKTGAEMEAAKQAKDSTLVYEQQAILKESIRSKYTFAEFVAFFKGFVLDLGQLTYDEGFLGEKRNQVYMESYIRLCFYPLTLVKQQTDHALICCINSLAKLSNVVFSS